MPRVYVAFTLDMIIIFNKIMNNSRPPAWYFSLTRTGNKEFIIVGLTRISSISQPAVRPGSTSTTALEFLHNKGNRVGFMKLLFQRMFIHCAMVLPFILY